MGVRVGLKDRGGCNGCQHGGWGLPSSSASIGLNPLTTRVVGATLNKSSDSPRIIYIASWSVDFTGAALRPLIFLLKDSDFGIRHLC